MIDILIMDDDANKVEALREVILPIFPEGEIYVFDTDNLVDGRELMQQRQFDLLILDQVMPEHSGEDASPTAGTDYLKEIVPNQSIKTPLQVIGLTGYEEHYREQQEKFREQLWYLLYYSRRETEWRTQLKEKIMQLYQFKVALADSINNRNKYDIGIICALREEFQQVISVFSAHEAWLKLRVDGLPYVFQTTEITTGNMHRCRIIAVCADKPGVCATSVIATTLYNTFKVDSIFMTGITAGIPNDELKLGDIVIARSIQDYSSGRLEEDEVTGDHRLLKELQQIPADQSLLQEVNTFIGDDDYIDELRKDLVANSPMKESAAEPSDNIQFHVSPSICGPFVMKAPRLVERFRLDDRKLQALDMEGFALYLAAHTLRKKALWIKSVSDFAGYDKNDNYHTYCSYASATFLYKFIREML